MDVPRTLLVTNDYPPRVGGIQRTLEALVRCFPADRVAVLCPNADGAAEFDELAPYEVFRQPERFLWPVPDVRRRVHGAVRSFGAEVVLFGAVYPLALLGPSLAEAGTPYLAAAHGFEYWLSIAPGSHALMRRATSRAARVPVMCSEFIARTVRTAVPADVRATILQMGQVAERIVANAGSVIAAKDVEDAKTLERDDDAMDDLHRELFSHLIDGTWKIDVVKRLDS